MAPILKAVTMRPFIDVSPSGDFTDECVEITFVCAENSIGADMDGEKMEFHVNPKVVSFSCRLPIDDYQWLISAIRNQEREARAAFAEVAKMWQMNHGKLVGQESLAFDNEETE